MFKRNQRWKGGVRKADSKWEETLRIGILSTARHHPDPIQYFIPKTYRPDFVTRVNNHDVYIEAKGRFLDREEARKYIFIAEELDNSIEYDTEGKAIYAKLVFLFMNPNLPMPGSTKRKDGSKLTHAEWADKQGIPWFTEENITEMFYE